MARRALLPLLLAFAAVTPAGASAATRHVAPGGVNGGACPVESPCGLSFGVTYAAPGDEVVVAPGDYELDAGVSVPPSVTVHGTPGAVPVVTGATSAPLISVGAGATLRFLRLAQRSGSRVLDASAAAPNPFPITLDNLFVERTGHGDDGVALASLGDNVVLRDSVVWALRPATKSVGVQLGRFGGGGGAAPKADLRNVDVWARSAGSSAIAVIGSCGADCSTGTAPVLRARNVIARGGTGGYDLLAIGNGAQSGVLGIDRSNYRSAATTAPGGTLAPGVANQTATDARLADPDNGDFHALPGPVVDAGVSDPFVGALDLDGYPRTDGSAPDIGAYERPLALTGSTEAATGVGATHATLQGAFDSRGRTATAYFDFGGDTRYGLRTPGQSFGPGSGPRGVGQGVGELEPNRVYHFRLVVVSAGVAYRQPDRSFRTAKACIVPSLGGVSLSRARRALGRSRCKLGHVSRPRRVRRGYTLVVASQRPGADAIRSVGSRVNLALAARRLRR